MKILAIGAHPDDIEIFMYGFLAKCKLRGDSIFSVVVTDGAAGDVRKKEKISDLPKIRQGESISALKNLCKPKFLKFPDGNLTYDESLRNEIKKLVELYNPNLIVTHYKKDYHPDHRILSKIVADVAGTKIPVLFSETLLGLNFKPDYYIDITDVFEEKVNSILCHYSQIPERFVKAIKIQNRFRSAQCNAPSGYYAECYKTFNSFPFADIRNMLPNSPKTREFFVEDSDALL